METPRTDAKLMQKRVLITGSTTGIGRATAILLARFDMRLVIVGRHEDQLQQTLNVIKADESAECHAIVADVANPVDLETLFNFVDERLGGLDILINNAALGYGSVTEGTYQDWEYILKTNLLAYLACSRYAIDRFKANGKGHLLMVGSMSADVREKQSAVYVATKSAIQGFCESLRKEVNPQGIHVTLVEPGAVDTDMQPDDQHSKLQQIKNQEMLEADDIAFAILFALSQEERCSIVELKIKPLKQLI